MLYVSSSVMLYGGGQATAASSLRISTGPLSRENSTESQLGLVEHKKREVLYVSWSVILQNGDGSHSWTPTFRQAETAVSVGKASFQSLVRHARARVDAVLQRYQPRQNTKFQASRNSHARRNSSLIYQVRRA